MNVSISILFGLANLFKVCNPSFFAPSDVQIGDSSADFIGSPDNDVLAGGKCLEFGLEISKSSSHNV